MFEESVLTFDEMGVCPAVGQASEQTSTTQYSPKKATHSHTAAHTQTWLRLRVMRLMLTHAHRLQGYEQ